MVDGSEEAIPSESVFLKKVPPFLEKKRKDSLTDWHTSSKDALISEIKKKIELEGKEPETKADWN